MSVKNIERTDVQKLVKTIESNGIAILENVLEPEECRFFVGEFERLWSERDNAGLNVGNSTSQVLRNYFFDYPKMSLFFDNDIVDAVLTQVIDEDYVLTSTSARNKKILKDNKSDFSTGGIGWHSDGKFLRGVRLHPSPIFQTIFVLEDFNESSGATQFIPNSHRWTEKVDRDIKCRYDTINAPAGSLIFLDSALIHRAGEATLNSRWGVWSIFSPWYIKPYTNFTEFYSKADLIELSPRMRRLLHFTSTPPGLGEDFNLPTLSRVRDAISS